MTFLLYRRPELENTLMVKNRSINRIIVLAALVTCLISSPNCATPARGESVEWVRQLGSPALDYSTEVSADGLGNVYMSGRTHGSLDGSNAGAEDAVVTKYDDAGNLLWTRQLGTPTIDFNTGVSADGLGNVYITGITDGSLGGPYAGVYDAFVSKYSAAGNLLWTRQLGTADDDESFGVSADRLGNVYISGETTGSLGGPNAGTEDVFVSKYSAAGNVLWTRQLGTATSDISYSVSADELGNVYISGITGEEVYDAFVSKYDAAGNFLWTQQFGATGNDESFSVSADGLGNVYISGSTDGSLDGPNAGSRDAFVSKYDAAGNFLWTRQLGTANDDYSASVSADRQGNVYISGSTDGSLDGPNAGSYDAFVSKYNAAGNFLWTRQLGTTSEEFSGGVSADRLGNVYFSGFTKGSLGGPNAGSYDAFVVKITDSPVPEPASLALLAFGLPFLMFRHSRRSPTSIAI
jgi:hypothetical protein